jgi:hypothetical protein
MAAAAIAKAIKASGVVVRVSPADFQSLLTRATGALVVHAEGGLFSTTYKYLKTPEPMQIPAHVETIRAAKMWVPE